MMLPLAGDPRRSTAAATSSGTESRPEGVRARTDSRLVAKALEIVLVTVKPGLTMLTRTPFAPVSHFRDASRPSRPAFAVEYAVAPAIP